MLKRFFYIVCLFITTAAVYPTDLSTIVDTITTPPKTTQKKVTKKQFTVGRIIIKGNKLISTQRITDKLLTQKGGLFSPYKLNYS